LLADPLLDEDELDEPDPLLPDVHAAREAQASAAATAAVARRRTDLI
jgi:hypothetical protein